MYEDLYTPTSPVFGDDYPLEDHGFGGFVRGILQRVLIRVLAGLLFSFVKFLLTIPVALYSGYKGYRAYWRAHFDISQAIREVILALIAARLAPQGQIGSGSQILLHTYHAHFGHTHTLAGIVRTHVKAFKGALSPMGEKEGPPPASPALVGNAQSVALPIAQASGDRPVAQASGAVINISINSSATSDGNSSIHTQGGTPATPMQAGESPPGYEEKLLLLLDKLLFLWMTVEQYKALLLNTPPPPVKSGNQLSRFLFDEAVKSASKAVVVEILDRMKACLWRVSGEVKSWWGWIF